MKLYTSYFAKLKELQSKGIIPISIARKPPYWFTGEQLLWLAPPNWLIKYPEEEYVPFYKKYILDKFYVAEVIKRLKAKYRGKEIALLCYEKSTSFCHRHVLAKWLNDGGLEVEEYGVLQIELFT